MLQTLFEIVLANAALATLLAIGVALFARRSRRPAIVHGLWLLVFLKLITPPLVTLPIQILPPPAEASTSAAAIVSTVASAVTTNKTPALSAIAATTDSPPPAAAGQPAGFQWRDHVTEGVVGVWIAGACAWLSLLTLRAWRFHRIARRTALAPAALQQQVRRLATAFGVPTVPEVRVIHAQVSPLLWRIDGRPVILLPAELLTELTHAQIDGILAHELAHLHRRDHWTRRFVLCVTALYWWHPLVWWGRRGLEQAAEQCCDAAVVGRFPDHNRDYAAALLKTIDFLTGARPRLPASATTFGQGRSLKRRFAMILDKGVSPRLSWKMRSVLATVGLAVLAVSPWVVAEEKREKEKLEPARKADFGISGVHFDRIYGFANDVKTESKTADKTAYRVICRVVNKDVHWVGAESTLTCSELAMESQLIVNEGVVGEIVIGRAPQGTLVPAKPGDNGVPFDFSHSAQIRLKDEAGTLMLHATIESSPGITVTNASRADHQKDQESGFVYSQKLKVIEKVRLGEKVKVPFDGSINTKTAKRLVEFEITRLEPAKPNSPDDAVLTFPAPVDDPNPPSEKEIRGLLMARLKENKTVPSFMETTAIKKLRVVIEPTVDKAGPEKFYPLVGLARLHERRYKCTAYFKVERQSDWPIRFTSVGNGEEVFYIDRDQLIRTTERPK